MRLTKNIWMLAAWMVAASSAAVAVDAPKEELTVPSAEVVKTFVTKAAEKAGSKTSLDFVVNFKPAILPARSMEAYRSKGKIPFTISVELNKTTMTEDGAEKQSVFEGTANMVVVDKEGKVVNAKTEDLSALCPS